MKKLSFTIQYLQNFITLDPVTGQKINKLSGKQLLTLDDLKSMNEEILAHQETIVDLYSVFMRSMVVKKDWPKKDHKFSIFDDLADSEYFIDNCKRVIDFTRCSYSIQQQSTIHVVIETTESKIQLLQFVMSDEAPALHDET